MRRSSILVLVVMLVVPIVVAQPTELKPVHPDETAKQTFEERFSLDTALERLGFVRRGLESFVKLTEACGKKVSAKAMEKIGNTDWETQNLGFRNAAGSIEGALRRQDWTIKHLQVQLVQERRKNGSASEEDVTKAQKAFDEADKSFREFWTGFGIAD
jgi:hypothetical protein